MELMDVVILLDRSGSMEYRKEDHEGGLRSFVKDLYLTGMNTGKSGRDLRLTFVRFDSVDPSEIVFSSVPLIDVDERLLTLVPRAYTPLLDAVGETLTRLRQELSSKTVVMIITDGQENASKRWTKEKVKTLVEDLSGRGWKFLYLGANVDQFSEAGSLGIAPGAAAAYAPTSIGTRSMYRVIGQTVSSTYASLGKAEWQTSSISWTEQQLRDMAGTDEEAEGDGGR